MMLLLLVVVAAVSVVVLMVVVLTAPQHAVCIAGVAGLVVAAVVAGAGNPTSYQYWRLCCGCGR